jgi:hypothetical protein
MGEGRGERGSEGGGRIEALGARLAAPAPRFPLDCGPTPVSSPSSHARMNMWRPFGLSMNMMRLIFPRRRKVNSRPRGCHVHS